MKVLLTGSKGQLGSCFCDRLPAGWDVLATDSDSLDITDLARVKQVVADYRPDAIVNAAAYTAVDKAETENELAARINEQGPKNLAQAAAEAGCRLIHVSTDYVFDGQAKTPYREADVTNPLGVYGKTKLDGEIAVAGAHPEAIIIRTAWVFSEYGNNFVKTMLRLAKDRDVLGIVADQRGCPTYAGDIAQAIIDLLQRQAEGGVYHFCGDKEVSWSEFAEAIFAAAMAQGLLEKSPQVNGITTEQYPTPAKRPAYSSLDCEKIERLGISRSNWVSALENTLKVAAV
ncbi:dTDP-4-dehydrorhamnose reductase [Serratia entomophila]|uniref:dTDP-4-dehydrorhamnose reductase n=7 Tax=Serratia entomophila TaxID=42906 RepID=A0ABY5CW86_9GAMM|nr:dTDP-4-dehydrorhamnose reductase [Serratia entomophila]UIW19908.1 dTDP-4-dehydrorhamnose reductase [Serratia entomophila]USV02428.1 dTDP-4-dehydrorhamnose reductase [Serratia entomophila]CAI0773281.1 dTDP-4-dehydrorhamnose reductase [Serratia entomophila]CAI0777675.1 dTDP-4-dehydrorhamnose reductase [Serratia entomophila]CAI0782711.1 dTDP-4-dehydrorhamnose reductase [Serratia entomophila]